MSSPRERFQLKVQTAQAADQLVSSALFDDASDAAMLQLVDTLTGGSNEPSAALANHYRLDGAKRFLGILKTIAKPQLIPARRDLDNLNQ
jgi:hypothetical protein